MIHSLRLRLAIGALVAIALALAITGYFLSHAFTDYVVERYRSEMSAVIDQISGAIELRKGRLELTDEPPDPRFGPPASGRYWQVLLQEGDVRRSQSLWDTALEPAAGQMVQGFSEAEGPDGAPVLVLVRSLTLERNGGRYPFTVMAGFSRSEFDEGLQAYHSTLASMLLLTAALLMAAAFLQGAVGLSPLKRLQQGVAEIRKGRLGRIETVGPREVRPLVSELNQLLEERETAIERARARASDLAHGLKTPLTVLLQLCDQLPPAERQLAYQQVELVRQRADRQLQAARLGVEQMVSTDLASLVAKLVMVLSPVTRIKGVAWRVDIPAGLSVSADAADIAECLGNILDNATKWARSGIEITAAETPGGEVEIVIADDGPGVAEEDHARILARGVRLGETVDARDDGKGSGLGLAISMDVVKAYGGSLTLFRSELGGLGVRLRFASAGA